MLCFSAGLLGCSTTPAERVANVCPDCEPKLLPTAAPSPAIQAWTRNGHEAPELHVYLEGDGNPWRNGRYPATNPNARKLMALRLMTLDPNPSVYINRPCYGHREMPTHCDPRIWTHERYSDEVVSALDTALSQAKRDTEAREIVLIGHSGGGTLAMLLAHRRSDVRAVITIGANLDHRAWTEHFGYLPLSGSLNPADYPELPERVHRWHFAGGRDQLVPAFVTQEAAAQDKHAGFIMQSTFAHNCCWLDIWNTVLQELRVILARPSAAHDSE